MSIDLTNNTLWSNTLGDSMLGSYGVDTITLSSVDYTTGVIPGANISYPSNPVLTVGQLGQPNTLQVNGDGADIVVNGESLMKTLRSIQDQLNVLRPNPALEAEWDQLRELGEQYRKLEAEFKEKSRMWNTLKK